MLDSETTGLTPPVGFVEIAIVDADAKTLFEGTVRPDCRIEPGATRIHRHTARSLANSPPFLEIYPDLLEALWGRRVIVYNASYDRRVWDAAVRSLGVRNALRQKPGSPWHDAYSETFTGRFARTLRHYAVTIEHFFTGTAPTEHWLASGSTPSSQSP